jgi:outer membrane lipoprotein-sorting protein
MSRWRLAAGAGLLLIAAPLWAQDARDVLLHSLERERAAAYEGLQTTTITDGGKTRRTEQVVKRRPPGKLRIEYLSPPRLKGELVVDDGDRYRHYIPALRVMEDGPSRLQRAMQRHQAHLQSLREGRTPVALQGEETLLGRKVDVVTVTPTRPERPTRTLWLDRETGVALKVEEKRHGGRTSVTTFEQIRFNPILGSEEFRLEPPAGVTVVPSSMGRPISVHRAEEVARRLWGALPTPGLLPAGYTLTSAHQLNFHDRPVIALRYTRGRDALSLFVSGGTGMPFAAPVQPRLNVVQRPMGGMLITLVGSQSSTELQQIVNSIHPSADVK